ncbi:type VI secretion system-associated FHA domain protein TagH [Undibacterium sp. Ren11W]|uniref:type VI secretion system-associated FHA domain protein TagH n=1 Tax=Undibacterium sp. Ren11W TaxID=3413045 RepID=UPI003BF20A0D
MIKIVAISYDNQPLIPSLNAISNDKPRGIGRHDENFLILPDPKHYVSRFQASVRSEGGHHFLINLSLANPILINDMEITPECEYAISPGDNIQIGLYRLRVDGVLSSSIERSTNRMRKPVLALKKQMTKIDASVSTGIAAAQIPPNFLLRRESDFLALNEIAFSSEKMPPNATSNLKSTTKPDLAVKAIDVPVVSDELFLAFLSGAGLSGVKITSSLTPQLMKTIGELLKTLVDGSMELISQRALLKRDVCSDLTVVVVEKNNPMKFFPDSQSVLTQMLGKKIPGFMAPKDAIADTFLDLKSHQSGLIAGMKAELNDLFCQLQPANFSKKLDATHLIDLIIPSRKKARMWDEFCAYHEQLSKLVNSEADNQAKYGKKFQSAYEKEAEKRSQPQDK